MYIEEATAKQAVEKQAEDTIVIANRQPARSVLSIDVSSPLKADHVGQAMLSPRRLRKQSRDVLIHRLVYIISSPIPYVIIVLLILMVSFPLQSLNLTVVTTLCL